MNEAAGALEHYIELTRKLYETGELSNAEWDEHRHCYWTIVEHGTENLRRRVHAEQLQEHFDKTKRMLNW